MRIRESRLRAAGHFYRHEEEASSKLILWEPKHGTTGTRQKTFLQVLIEDTGVENTAELATLMQDRSGWNTRCNEMIPPPLSTSDDDGRLRSK